VVLDGANRSTAARAAGWPHMLVQVVRYESPAGSCKPGTNALTPMRENPRARDPALPGLDASTRRVHCPRAARAARSARVRRAGRRDVLVCQGGATLHERNRLLNSLVHLYQDRLPYTRDQRFVTQARLRTPECERS
jgi:hypothetical protein